MTTGIVSSLSLFILLSALVHNTHCKEIVLSWKITTYSPITVAEGDIISFEWEGSHNVAIHPSGTCDMTGSSIVGSTSGDQYTFTSGDVGTEVTFACQVNGHCSSGQILKVAVAAKSGIDCPLSGSITVAPSEMISLNVVSSDRLCILTLKQVEDGKESLIPLGRSYDDNDWETVAGPHRLQFICDTKTCTSSSLPAVADNNSVLQLTTFSSSDSNLSKRDVVARFFTQATFGPTEDMLADWDDKDISNLDNSFASWVDDQINTIFPTSHRVYFRKRAATRFDKVHSLGAPPHPCDASTRWNSYAFTKGDCNPTDPVTFGRKNKIRILSTSDLSGYTLFINDIPRTEVDVNTLNGGTMNTYGAAYEFCFDGIEEKEGGMVLLRIGGCQLLDSGNAKIKFESSNPQYPPNMISLSAEDASKIKAIPGTSKGEEFVLTERLTSSDCNNVDVGTYPVYLNFNNGTYLAFDPRLSALENTVENPLQDGGGTNKVLGSKCANAPMTFLNAKHCRLSSKSNSCAYNDADDVPVKDKVRVCGSPNEVANDVVNVEGPQFGYEIHLDSDLNLFDKYYQKEVIWNKVALNADDQLRQRTAWALSQIFAIDPDSQQEKAHTEGFVSYYDIFVRHAFGSYLDILKEVSYSPFMAEMLTYHWSWSTAFAWLRFKKVLYADENYAREIMQLFTIGTIMLNLDGTPITDPSTGAPKLAYTNEHIMSFARAWTGFGRQESRANVDQGFNRIDPMKIDPLTRDVFPKIDLLDGYIGDGYPLCMDLPKRSFLRKGAKYRLLGSSTTLELHSNPTHHRNFDPLAKIVSLDPSSELYNLLCNPTSLGGTDCNFRGEISLEENISCYGQECKVDTLRLLEVTEGVYYEYVRQACVELTYYKNAKKIMLDYRHIEMCADPRLDVAGEACCSKYVADFGYEKSCEYGEERVTYDTAAERCEQLNQQLCSEDFMAADTTQCVDHGCCHHTYFFHWQKNSCLLQVKVEDVTGKIAVVHKPTDSIENVPTHLRPSSFNFFPVYWASDYPNLSNNCGNGACEVLSDGCLCSAEVEESGVFHSSPASVEEVLSKLRIGSVSPDTFDDGYYNPPITNGDVKTYTRTGGTDDIDTIFEVQVKGKTKFFKNIESSVHILNSDNDVLYSFRNPPHFINFLEGDYVNSVDSRDAYHETDAVLEHYFHHPNVPPFLAIHFIQRFGISNPSPKYVEVVATAFRDGIYVYNNGIVPSITYGTGEYGNLGATVAATLLHREARSVVLDFDPTKGSLKEPIIKVMNFMRAMDYKPFDGYEYEDVLPWGPSDSTYDTKGTRFNSMTEKMGQMAYDPDNIFSFFRREFSPKGPISKASLVAPDAQRYTTSKVIGLINGLFSLIKFGLSDCNKGFGEWMRHFSYYCNTEGQFINAWGKLNFAPKDKENGRSVVDEMSTLLTAGRLNEATREIIADEYNKADNDEAALRIAQQLMVVSPEFQGTDMMEFNGEERQLPPTEPVDENGSYKAVVYLFLEGGFDSYNLLVPHSNCPNKDMYREYQQERGVRALFQGSLLRIDASKEPQVCTTFGIHPDLPLLKNLYDDSDLTFFANTGVLFEYVTKENYEEKMLTQLFAHNIQQKDTQQVDPHQDVPGTGVLGRMADALTEVGYKVGTYSLVGETYSLAGEGVAPFINQVETSNDPEFNPRPTVEGMESTMFKINNPSTLSSGFYGKTWSNMFEPFVRSTETLTEALKDATTSVSFPQSLVGKSLEKISSLIKHRVDLNNDRQIFHLKDLMYDTHGGAGPEDLLTNLNEALTAFVNELKAIDMWDDVVLVMASDFGRTLTPNTGGGTDHGWGGNYFLMGGALDGGRILGEYPDDLTVNSPLNVGRGRFIPTTSWDTIMDAVAQWMGVTDGEKLTNILPNRNNFDLLGVSKVFDVPTPTGLPTPTPTAPTPSPSKRPVGPTKSPTSEPTKMPVKPPPIAEWYPVAGQGGVYDDIGSSMTDTEFRVIWDKSPNKILRRLCTDCSTSHQDIYYRRFDSDSALPAQLDLLETVKNQWVSSTYNEFNVNFALYSTYEDALGDVNRWQFCNFAANIGFPRDCGPDGPSSLNWNNFANHVYGKRDVGFYVETFPDATGKPSSRPSNEPAETTAPTSKPTSKPNPTPTSKPNPTPTSKPNPTPTSNPTLLPGVPTRSPDPTSTSSPSKGDLWYIEKASVSFDAVQEISQMKISHKVGSGADNIRATLYRSDCKTPVDSDDPISIDDSNNSLLSGVAQYVVSMDTSTLSTSVLFHNDKIELCSMIEIIDSQSGFSVSFRHTKFSITLDLTTAFFVVSMDVDGIQIDDISLDNISLYKVNACQCQTSFSCESVPAPVKQNTAFGVCIFPSSAGVRFENFDMTITGDGGFSYAPITFDDTSGQVVNPLTSVDTQGTMTRIVTQAVSNLFLDGSTTITIQGVGELSFDDTAKQKSKDDSSSSAKKRFEMKLTLSPPDDLTFFDTLLRMFTDFLGSLINLFSPLF